jgi:hypothetical protein
MIRGRVPRSTKVPQFNSRKTADHIPFEPFGAIGLTIEAKLRFVDRSTIPPTNSVDQTGIRKGMTSRMPTTHSLSIADMGEWTQTDPFMPIDAGSRDAESQTQRALTIPRTKTVRFDSPGTRSQMAQPRTEMDTNATRSMTLLFSDYS